jgi:hypothetical protein
MNYPEQNKRALATLEGYATHWQDVPSACDAGKQAMKMQAALRLVLTFHSGEPWTPEWDRRWIDLQEQAGVLLPRAGATTKNLCDVIREVLGESS